ncbi:RNA ligase family protein [Bacillus alkalicellulosilyticus]|uniref:ATP-dependent DNA ligase n=1 Tax=Alkalihalobacterium alkalicellulosilyticum TaxID=1912214 RepID=UPI000997BB48|nr:RNA ligase family protein [Bacillus alkalicellulosilyticus]
MFVKPMLLEKAQKPFNDDSYITELKMDGIRLLLSKFNDKIKLYTRHNNEVTHKFKELHHLDIPNGTILDGEIIVPGDHGKPDFESMMSRFMSSTTNHTIQFVIFDIIYYNGSKVKLPLLERKQLLESIITESQYIVLSKWILGNAVEYFDFVESNGLEGIVQKKANSRYEINRRSSSWLKVINYNYANGIFITGIRKNEFGVKLILDNGEYKGIMEFMPKEERKKLFLMAQNHIINETDSFIYLEPIIKVNIKYRNMTSSNKYRIPSFNGWSE